MKRRKYYTEDSLYEDLEKGFYKDVIAGAYILLGLKEETNNDVLAYHCLDYFNHMISKGMRPKILIRVGDLSKAILEVNLKKYSDWDYSVPDNETLDSEEVKNTRAYYKTRNK